MAWPLIRLIPRSTHFRFVKWAPVAAIFSVLLIVGSGVSFFTQGLNLGIDFKGGVALEARMPTPIPTGELRTALAGFGAHDAQVQPFGSPNNAMIRFLPEANQNPNQAAVDLEAKLKQRFPTMTIPSHSAIGAKVSGELLGKGGLIPFVSARDMRQADLPQAGTWRHAMLEASLLGAILR